MIHKLAWRNMLRNPVMNILMVLQMVIICFIAISMTSSVLSRFSYYLPFKQLLKSDGAYYCFFHASDPETGMVGTTTEELTAKLQGTPTVAASYLAWLTYSEQKTEQTPTFISMDDFWLESYVPELQEGNWFFASEWEKDTIPIVISQNDDGLAVGDVVTFVSFGTEQPIDCEVIGVLQEGARIMGYTIPGNDAVSCKHLYQNYYHDIENTMLVILPQADLDTSVVNTELHGSMIVSYPEGTSEQMQRANHFYLSGMQTLCSISFDRLYRSSMAYILEECRTLSPILAAILIMTLVSTMSVNALSVKRQLYHYAIYYICGLRWKKCILINLLSSLYLSAFSLLVTLTALLGLRHIALLQESVIAIGFVQILVCIVVLLIYVGFSVLLPIRMIHGNTPNQILCSN